MNAHLFVRVCKLVGELREKLLIECRISFWLLTALDECFNTERVDLTRKLLQNETADERNIAQKSDCKKNPTLTQADIR